MLVNLLRSFLRRKYEMRGEEEEEEGGGRQASGIGGVQDCFAKLRVRGNEDKIQTARKKGRKERKGGRVAVLIRF